MKNNVTKIKKIKLENQIKDVLIQELIHVIAMNQIVLEKNITSVIDVLYNTTEEGSQV